ncbi:nitroreductase family protein [Paenibacillus nasutitermitis]|uniref:Putative NAD(P)H nitroreductase n=1 Tax=Paenibacillus nasutitermitis TaxID=1652958 RepID=A0A917DZL8_9BACL|nr:nitroreductase [Paenibacillus nasutitermitis]GGD83965.1 putative NAD(P)H nitroreductase YfhC [Paenibacillus nasutitermitis]
MELAKLLKERRSVHVFEDREVPLETVQELLETAVWVPNHRMTQPWRFVIIYGDGRKRLGALNPRGKGGFEKDPAKVAEMAQKFHNKMMGVPMYVVVLMKEHPVLGVREEDYASTSCIIHNLSLLLWEQGIGMVWESYGFMHDTGYREAVGACPGEKVVGSLHLGYPERVPAAQARIPASQLTTVISET